MNNYITTSRDLGANFWVLNPYFIYMDPFDRVYNIDQGKDQSSRHMWCVFWMSYPDEDLNIYYRIDSEERLGICKKYNPKFDIDDELIKECMEAFPEKGLTTIERSLKYEKEALLKRAIFLQKAEYDFDTMSALDNAFSKTSKIFENFGKIEQEFLRSKSKDIQIHGGRRQTLRERGALNKK